MGIFAINVIFKKVGKIFTLCKYPTGITTNLIQTIRQLHLHRFDPEYQFQEIKKFDQSYDLLWNKYKNKYKAMTVRNSTTLNWIFFGSKELTLRRKVLEVKYRQHMIAYVAINIVPFITKGATYYFFDIIG